ncbi:MAG TPA: polysaccharide biosynthesis C-terminal domain-containing protein, partial [Croceibacterium sp.]|nr:polysaccharide biosynthesis C-terminal domain-containing protein [Croceibacterium sp.]
FASRISTALVLPLSGLMIFASRDIISIYRKEALPAVPILALLATGRAFESIVGPASSIIEMAGHRLLPLINGAVAVALWATLSFLLVPEHGAWGMAIAVAIASVVATYLAVIELQASDGVSPFDRWIVRGVAIALAGLATMWFAEFLFNGPVRFVTLVLIWALTSWVAMRYALPLEDRVGLGKLSRTLRLIEPKP